MNLLLSSENLSLGGARREITVASNPLGAGLASACAVILVLMLLGFGPMGTLTQAYGKLHLRTALAAKPQSVPAQPAAAPTTQTAMGNVDAR